MVNFRAVCPHVTAIQSWVVWTKTCRFFIFFLIFSRFCNFCPTYFTHWIIVYSNSIVQLCKIVKQVALIFIGWRKNKPQKKTERVTALWIPKNMAPVLDNPVNTKHKLLNYWQTVSLSVLAYRSLWSSWPDLIQCESDHSNHSRFGAFSYRRTVLPQSPGSWCFHVCVLNIHICRELHKYISIYNRACPESLQAPNTLYYTKKSDLYLT